MPRTKSRPVANAGALLAPHAAPSSSPQPTAPPPRRTGKRKRAQTQKPPPHFYIPADRHVENKVQVAVLLQLPLVNALTFDLPKQPVSMGMKYEERIEPHLPREGGSVNGKRVFVKHTHPTASSNANGVRNVKGGYRKPDSHEFYSETVLLVAVVSDSENVLYELDLGWAVIPVVVYHLVQTSALSLHVTNDNCLQFILHDIPRSTKLDTLIASFVPWIINFVQTSSTALVYEYEKEWVYSSVRRTSEDEDIAEYVQYIDSVQQNSQLNATLRPYQQRAVAWMLSRELKPPPLINLEAWKPAAILKDSCVLSDHAVVDTVFLDPLVGDVIWRAYNNDAKATQRARGGLLCDEMGLGKTVELMQLVLCNQLSPFKKFPEPTVSPKCTICRHRVHGGLLVCKECCAHLHEDCYVSDFGFPDTSAFLCPKCAQLLSKLCCEETKVDKLPKSKATLVVIPTALLQQWKAEIQKHAKNALNIFVFLGLHRTGYVSQRTLLNADIVITTYDALKYDVKNVRSTRNPRTNMRYDRKYTPTPVPLLTIHWHRLALDESQMLGGKGWSLAGSMASYLHATYRWCITGTPMRKYLSDAESMFNVVRFNHRDDAIDWSQLFANQPYEQDHVRLRGILRNIMWRSSKDDVQEANELSLPPQITEVVRTRFGPIENYHYKSLLRSFDTAVSNIRRRVIYPGSHAERVSSDLLTTLRQACCHPRIGAVGRRLFSNAAPQPTSGGKRVESSLAKAKRKAASPMDMGIVLDSLLTNALKEGAESMRSLAACCNGIAAFHLLKHSLRPAKTTVVSSLVAAVQQYREILRIAEDNRKAVKLDDIQRMHVYHNLEDALETVDALKAYFRIHQGTSNNTTALETLESLGRSVQETTLGREVNKLQRKYVADAATNVTLCTQQFERIADELGEKPLINLLEDNEENRDEENCETRLESLIDIEKHKAEDAGNEQEPDRDSSDEVNRNGENSDEEAFEKSLERAQREAQYGSAYWWEKALAKVMEAEERGRFLEDVIEQLAENIPRSLMNERTSIGERLSKFFLIPLVISDELRKLQIARNKFISTLRVLPGSREPTIEEIYESGNCKKCRDTGDGPNCLHCRSEILMVNVEKSLFFVHEKKKRKKNKNMLRQEREGDFQDGSRLGLDSEEDERNPSGKQNSLALTRQMFGASRREDNNAQFSRNLGVGEIEVLMKAFIPYVRRFKDDELNEEMKDWMNKFEMLKEELVEAKKLFEAQRGLLACKDEISMALMRFSILEEGADVEDLGELAARHRLPKASLSPLLSQYEKDKVVAEADFQAKRGSIAYLQSLKRSAEESTSPGKRKLESSMPENCAVCLTEFDETLSKVAVLVCGHVFCCECTLMMIGKGDSTARHAKISCPTCRSPGLVDGIKFTSTIVQEKPSSKRQKVEEDEITLAENRDKKTIVQTENVRSIRKRPGMPTMSPREEKPSTFYKADAFVIGQFGSKTTAMVRLLHGIWGIDESHKVIIFSEWVAVLDLVQRALERNQISYVNGADVKNGVEFSNRVEKFKSSENANVILLPMKRASAGLNLTEARHVVLMEPTMNVSLEAQAVGRIHRIGQAHTTYVHRIVVSDSVEDPILRLGDKFRGKMDADVPTEVTLDEIMAVLHASSERPSRPSTVADGSSHDSSSSEE